MSVSISHLLASADNGGEALRLILLAQIDRAPERLKPLLRQARLRLTLEPVEALLQLYPPEKIEAFLTTLEALAEMWPHVKARRLAPPHVAPAGPLPNHTSQGGTHDGV